MTSITVVIADDHAIVREGLRTYLGLQEGIDLVGVAANGQEAVEKVCATQPDVALLDLVMPEMDGIQATTAIQQCSPATCIIILTSFADDDKVFPALRAGAQGYLLKDTIPSEIAQAIRDAHEGQTPLHPTIVRKLMEQSTLPPTDPDKLTPRETDVLRHIARGENNREIGAALGISPKTVKTHISHILDKLQLADRTQAAIYALKNDIE